MEDKIIQAYTEKIREKVDCEGLMHCMYFWPGELGFDENEIDWVGMNIWRPKTLRNESQD